jgi:hypothetical protein
MIAFHNLIIPKDIWSVICEFNHVVFIGDKIVDVSNLINDIMKNRIYASPKRSNSITKWFHIELSINEKKKCTIYHYNSGLTVQTHYMRCGESHDKILQDPYTSVAYDENGNISLIYEHFEPYCYICRTIIYQFN